MATPLHSEPGGSAAAHAGRRPRRLLLGALSATLALLAAGLGSPPAAAGPLPAPTGLAVRPVLNASLDVRWSQTPGALTYELTATGGGTTVGPKVALGTQYTFGPLAVGVAYTVSIKAVGLLGVSPVVSSEPVTTLPNDVSPAVTGVTTATMPATTNIQVSWIPPTSGLLASYFAVATWRATSGALVDLRGCFHPCTQTVITGLDPGLYRVSVAGTNFWPGYVWVPAPGPVAVSSGCPVRACLTVDANADLGPAIGRAQGVNYGLAGTRIDVVRQLRLRHARLSGAGDYAVAVTEGMKINLNLSDTWITRTGGGTGMAAKPWDDWTAYETWLRNYVTFAKHVGMAVEWWEIQNEPYVGYFTGDDTQYLYTDAQLQQHFLRAYRVIKSVLPTAKVIGPSFGTFNLTQMTSFLDFAATNELQFDGYVWHELSTEPARGPEGLVRNVAEMRRLIAERPALGAPAILVNEYSSPASNRLAGWQVAWIAGIERADVAAAMVTCPRPLECYKPVLSDLVDIATQQPRAPWWVHRFYADQTGRRLPVTASTIDVAAFATRDGDTVRVLAGRAETCNMVVNAWCEGSARWASAPFDTSLTVTGAWADGTPLRVTVARIPATDDVVVAPVPVQDTVVTADGHGGVVVSLPAVADGDAFTIVVTPAV